MPIDIASSVVPEYTAAIPVPLDGEYATSATLIDMVAPIANRIEFLRQGIDSDPWRRTVDFEDWARQDLDGEILSGDSGTWALNESPQVFTALGVVGGDANAYGRLQLLNSSGSASSARLARDPTALPGRFDQIESLAARMSVDSIASGMGVEFGAFSNLISGIAQATGDGVAWIFQPSASPNWRLRSVLGGASTLIDSGIAVSAGTQYLLRIDQTAPGTFVGRVDDGSPHTVVSTIPGASSSCAHQTKFITPNAGANRSFTIDFTYARFGLPGRVL
jgi:hypothetical protein